MMMVEKANISKCLQYPSILSRGLVITGAEGMKFSLAFYLSAWLQFPRKRLSANRKRMESLALGSIQHPSQEDTPVSNRDTELELEKVVLFPGTKDQSWRWQTSNNDYGKFYLSLSREALGARCRADGLHSECNRKCEQLARQLCELKAELDRLKVGSRLHSPLDKDGCRDGSGHNGDCLFSEKARMPCDDMFHTTHDIEYNGGRRTEPQVLEDHLKADHPRLVKKVPPLNPIGTSCFDAINEQSDGDPRYGRGKVSKYWTGGLHGIQIHSAPGTAHSDGRMNMYRRPESAGSGGLTSDQTAGEYHHHGGSGGATSPRSRIHHHGGGNNTEITNTTPKAQTYTGGRVPSGGRGEAAREKILPPSQRYNFYRYYGFAGQGAKTSRGWNSK